MDVGFIGLGAMGLLTAKRVVGGGYKTYCSELRRPQLFPVQPECSTTGCRHRSAASPMAYFFRERCWEEAWHCPSFSGS